MKHWTLKSLLREQIIQPVICKMLPGAMRLPPRVSWSYNWEGNIYYFVDSEVPLSRPVQALKWWLQSHNTSITNHSFLCAGVRVMRTFTFYSCSNFQVYYTVLAIINSDQAVKKVSRSYFFCLSETLHLLLTLLHSSSTPNPSQAASSLCF